MTKPAKGSGDGGEPNPARREIGRDTADGGEPSKRRKVTQPAKGARNGEEDEENGDSDKNNPVQENKETEDQASDDSSPPLASSGSEEEEVEDVAAGVGQEHEPQQHPAVNAPNEPVPPAPLDNPDPAPAGSPQQHHHHQEPLQVGHGSWNSNDQEWTPPPAANIDPEAGPESPSPRRRLVSSRTRLRFEDE